MKTQLEKIIRLRNPAFCFDKALSGAMLRAFLWQQVVRLVRGWRTLLWLQRPQGALLGRGVCFHYRSRIRWGRFMKLDTGVCLSALGIEGITLGNHVSIGAYSRVVVSTSLNHVGQHIRIGHHVGIGEFAYLGGGGGLEIGDDTIIGQYFSCHPENHNYRDLTTPIRSQGVTRKGIAIGSNCWIGSKVTVLDGVNIGTGCVVAAGAVVTQSFPPHSVIGGVPAKLINHRHA
ncbi:acyltransferase [Chryseolinea lacunae]|uniref:Acyltransferase n=1 Tax=Chryseolinea lacunae TaxID=2801331 RepID=A0ABS1L2X3_9BACT|nr:acyltransferase [Chryseolinea lacunae]MBL0745842.1 acyltransferase [Chryseolinea lacunae]